MRCGFPSANLMTTWPGPSRIWMLGGSIDIQDSQKKLFVAPEFRSASRGHRTPSTCKLTIIKHNKPLVVVVSINRACSTGKIEGRAVTGGPEPPSQPVGRPAPTKFRTVFECTTIAAPSFLVLITCADIGAGAHLAARCPGFLQRRITICRPVRTSLLWCVARRLLPDDSITSISISSEPGDQATVAIVDLI